MQFHLGEDLDLASRENGIQDFSYYYPCGAPNFRTAPSCGNPIRTIQVNIDRQDWALPRWQTVANFPYPIKDF